VNDYSFAGQHDPPFWVGMSPPELARQLNKLVDLDVIDLVTSRVSSRIRQYTVEERVVGERYKDACGRVTATAYVPTMDEILQSLESLQSEIHQLRQRSLGLNQLVAEIKWDQQRLAQLKGLLIKGKVLARKGGELINRQNWYNKVKAIVDDINQLQRKTGRPVPDLSELTKLKEECEASVKREEGLSGLLEVVASSERELKGLKERLVAARKQLKEETKGLCPICGGKLKDE
jgi:DNA repair exonuclease SbcCD ATPase subunit